MILASLDNTDDNSLGTTRNFCVLCQAGIIVNPRLMMVHRPKKQEDLGVDYHKEPLLSENLSCFSDKI